jgi:hypothetical protein
VTSKDGSVVSLEHFNNGISSKVLTPEEGSVAKVYEYKGVGHEGKNPAFTDVTDDILKQAQAETKQIRPVYRELPEGGAAGDNMGVMLRGNFGKVAGKEVKEGEYSSLSSYVESSQDISRVDFNKHLREIAGPPPADMVDPHAHHILFKEGNGAAQKALVKEGQDLLRRNGIDPIFGKENLVWAPNRVAGQHDIAALRNVIEQVKAVELDGGTYDDIVDKLRKLGVIAAARR